MAFSELIMWSIIVTTAATLHPNGVTNIQTAEQAIPALQPLVKSFPNASIIAKTIFMLELSALDSFQFLCLLVLLDMH
jgi:hypothetical protein